MTPTHAADLLAIAEALALNADYVDQYDRQICNGLLEAAAALRALAARLPAWTAVTDDPATWPPAASAAQPFGIEVLVEHGDGIAKMQGHRAHELTTSDTVRHACSWHAETRKDVLRWMPWPGGAAHE